ncbi:hypothetical protein AMECASPLE_012501 [Ameca splendens]|uniref:Uncharacterized protein n=1 Tax=Ameca splendens TaxID=208324 RepID=A0ABV0ZC94_9TELE
MENLFWRLTEELWSRNTKELLRPRSTEDLWSRNTENLGEEAKKEFRKRSQFILEPLKNRRQFIFKLLRNRNKRRFVLKPLRKRRRIVLEPLRNGYINSTKMTSTPVTSSF